MASGFVFKGEVWVLGGRRLGGAGLEIVSSGEVFMPKLQKWHLVLEMWLKHLQWTRPSMENGVKRKILGVGEDSLWALTEEPFVIFELETSVEMALKWARPSEETVFTAWLGWVSATNRQHLNTFVEKRM
uniref:Uncharacterized protein n=1 Tax=Nelumbo nucifera TaxID=4432 RepID=A0A822Z0F9_NELNU|nr:TPA_asm: hypothetical protein HUJ06_007620 [Nelumbo nucifera]